MIVPDFGVDAEDKTMVALKKEIELGGSHIVKVVDLTAMVRAEHVGEELTEDKVIELAARKLEPLSSCRHLVWDSSDNVAESDNYEWGAPNAIVVFGKSTMLAGNLGRQNVLFINPIYDSEWPWKKQYYADIKQVGQYHSDKHDFESGFMKTVLWAGVERTDRWKYSQRYGLITDADYIGEFRNRYPCMAEVNRDLENSTAGLAKFICKFSDDEMSFPLDEVYEAINNLQQSDISYSNEICNFIEPIKLNGITILGILFGAPMANGQSGYKLKVKEYDYTLPLERLQTRRDLNTLRDAIIRAGENLKKNVPSQKRILIVPDYFTPYNSPNVKELYDCLTRGGYYVAVYVHGETLKKSRAGIERRCKVKPFDLIVALETGCVLTTRLANCQRIFVNPDWCAWEWMNLHLGDKTQLRECRGTDDTAPFSTYYLNRPEVAMARGMAERANIKRGDKPVYGWFTVDAVESYLPAEHLKRFKSSTYIPNLRLDSE